MTTTTYNDNVEILGSQDITQLLVKCGLTRERSFAPNDPKIPQGLEVVSGLPPKL